MGHNEQTPMQESTKLWQPYLRVEPSLSGDQVCYSHRLQSHRTVRIEKILCNNDSGNNDKEFQSKEEVSVAELISTAYAFVAGSVSPSLSTIDPDCSDWIPDAAPYVFIKTRLSWYDAATACHEENAHLAFIECKTENEFILNIIEQELRDVNCEINAYVCNVWIGLNDLQEEGEPVCYFLRYLDDRNVRINKVECKNSSQNNVEKFQSEQDVSVGELLDLMYSSLEPTLLPSSSTTDPADCSDWRAPDPGYYILNKTKMSWSDAVAACHHYGENAHLAFIECETENDFILRFIEEQLREVNCETDKYFCDVWIGLNGKKQDGIWKWYETTVQFFGSQTVIESGGEMENCGRLAETPLWEWRDTDCDDLHYSICET
ncbi:C-type lectin lectoxin-Lio2 [Holothuria leucospilota]|uniref:C-type lectin lectoxin-Lio2 n=1 Tax=Holothuria leucospilota TaxID=206669 RepID=A0A9Q1HA35_HOLLE|nr:C-type lectin lectoxin-Lio2 [Holothuria leucospilota]